ncbi:hypothetical protein [Rhodococcus sp. OK302]|uniref:hypothetical protein n=1 Tax=Rhodococcus sp. OK302 TaxID=1882769 RepID=UPI001594EA8F|nr:hypothetical protein [Rhodococcus sp. OK302]
MTATMLRQCRRQIGFTDELLREGRDLPELAHPDAAMTDVLGPLPHHLRTRCSSPKLPNYEGWHRFSGESCLVGG